MSFNPNKLREKYSLSSPSYQSYKDDDKDIPTRQEQIEELERKDKIHNDYISKLYNNRTENVLVEKEVVSKYRTKTKKSKIVISTYQSSTNHKIVQISELYYDYSTDDYRHSKKNVNIPIKDFKKILNELNDSF